jgi:hypothetical protein
MAIEPARYVGRAWLLPWLPLPVFRDLSVSLRSSAGNVAAEIQRTPMVTALLGRPR